MGRPSSYTQAIADEICEGLAGGRSLHRLCKEEGFPHEATVYRWLQENDSFRESYAHARDRQADRFASEIIEIVDEEEDAARARVRMDARKWAASKLAPKKYGDKVEHQHGGENGGAIAFTWLPPQGG